ncbi:MAG: translation initiation factor IF-2 [Thermoanaerobaculales bacterium]|jgi:translation initiation factor IF-2|nr:translation initiation factor IF-2 [Thermoanaerobaculales bacterium]
MEQLRVCDLAHTMGITAKELIFKLRSIGVNVTSEEDALDLSTVRSIITGETLQRRPREVIVRAEKPEEDATTTTARDRMVKRRRRQVVKTDKQILEVRTPEKPEDEEADDIAEIDTLEGVEVELEAEAVEEIPAVDEAEPAEVEEELDAVETTEEKHEAPAEEPVEEVPVEAVTVAGEEPADVAEATETDAAAADEAPEAEEAPVQAEDAEPETGADEEPTPEVEITEEEIIAGSEMATEEEPKRVRPGRAKTPLEKTLRELSPDEIRQRLKAQKEVELKRKAEKAAGGGRKAKSAADAQEIRELLNKFEEQKLKGQQEGTTSPRPAPRPTGGRPGKKGRRRPQRDTERRPAPPRPTRTLQFKDGIKPDGPILLSEMVTARELAEKLNVTAKDLLGLLIQKGVMVTTNQALPHELAEEICSDLEIDAMVATAEELIDYEREEAEQDLGPQVSRPPVVTVMGHVDHGKTSLLDAIRSTRVAEGEAGGITQHIGASRITSSDGRTVVFVDTPGHEAFTQMRARGAQVTDIVVLVVAADDGVMPQTKEAINHARAGNVPLIVAVNKIDKANANPDRVLQQLAEQEVLVESWGGDVPMVQVSAKTGQGIPDVLDMILLVAEMKELTATEQGAARGVVLEARKEKGRGIVATVLIQQGMLSVGDYFFCGSTWGRVRALADDAGARIKSAGPSSPVEVMGFEDVPAAGDILQGTADEAKALEVSSFRSQKEKDEGLMATRKVSLENLFDSIAESETKELNVVIKADVQGSVEVLRETLNTLGTEKVTINVLHGSVGAITTNDVMLASASNAIIIGFAVRPERTARELADAEQVDIRLYTVIYDLVDDVRKAMVGLLEPIYREEELGHAEVREIFRVPKIGAIAGCHVIDGVITRSAKARLLRDHVVIYEGELASLRRFKDDASEVRQGFDCGIGLARYQDIKEGDVIEAYKMVEVTPEL